MIRAAAGFPATERMGILGRADHLPEAEDPCRNA
jgi:hypothetical protein